LGVIIWEVLNRCIKGVYAAPYSDMNFFADCQILISVAKKGARPTVPPNCPDSFKMMLRSCWLDDPSERPDCGFLLGSLRSIRDREYKEKKKEWDALFAPQGEGEGEGEKKQQEKGDKGTEKTKSTKGEGKKGESKTGKKKKKKDKVGEKATKKKGEKEGGKKKSGGKKGGGKGKKTKKALE